MPYIFGICSMRKTIKGMETNMAVITNFLLEPQMLFLQFVPITGCSDKP